MKLREIAERLGCRLAGDGNLEISGVVGIEHAREGELTFLSNPRYAGRLKETKASAVIVGADVEDLPQARLVSENPYLDFARALELFYQPPRLPAGVHATAVVASSAVIAENASIGACAVIGENVRIGRNAVIHPHVTIYDGVQIGDDLLAH
jgi:UDP-3-O-[3-hydroxymyristoyl] glucosamine N-acyltransferase